MLLSGTPDLTCGNILAHFAACRAVTCILRRCAAGDHMNRADACTSSRFPESRRVLSGEKKLTEFHPVWDSDLYQLYALRQAVRSAGRGSGLTRGAETAPVHRGRRRRTVTRALSRARACAACGRLSGQFSYLLHSRIDRLRRVGFGAALPELRRLDDLQTLQLVGLPLRWLQDISQERGLNQELNT